MAAGITLVDGLGPLRLVGVRLTDSGWGSYNEVRVFKICKPLQRLPWLIVVCRSDFNPSVLWV